MFIRWKASLTSSAGIATTTTGASAASTVPKTKSSSLSRDLQKLAQRKSVGKNPELFDNPRSRFLERLAKGTLNGSQHQFGTEVVDAEPIRPAVLAQHRDARRRRKMSDSKQADVSLPDPLSAEQRPGTQTTPAEGNSRLARRIKELETERQKRLDSRMLTSPTRRQRLQQRQREPKAAATRFGNSSVQDGSAKVSSIRRNRGPPRPRAPRAGSRGEEADRQAKVQARMAKRTVSSIPYEPSAPEFAEAPSISTYTPLSADGEATYDRVRMLMDPTSQLAPTRLVHLNRSIVPKGEMLQRIGKWIPEVGSST
ncbi:hypothetical protein PYCC9005_003018 [Savitreella phatthalungensis]